jgi:hypothetical protein
MKTLEYVVQDNGKKTERIIKGMEAFFNAVELGYAGTLVVNDSPIGPLEIYLKIGEIGTVSLQDSELGKIARIEFVSMTSQISGYVRLRINEEQYQIFSKI